MELEQNDVIYCRKNREVEVVPVVDLRGRGGSRCRFECIHFIFLWALQHRWVRSQESQLAGRHSLKGSGMVLLSPSKQRSDARRCGYRLRPSYSTGDLTMGKALRTFSHANSLSLSVVSFFVMGLCMKGRRG